MRSTLVLRKSGLTNRFSLYPDITQALVIHAVQQLQALFEWQNSLNLTSQDGTDVSRSSRPVFARTFQIPRHDVKKALTLARNISLILIDLRRSSYDMSLPPLCITLSTMLRMTIAPASLRLPSALDFVHLAVVDASSDGSSLPVHTSDFDGRITLPSADILDQLAWLVDDYLQHCSRRDMLYRRSYIRDATANGFLILSHTETYTSVAAIRHLLRPLDWALRDTELDAGAGAGTPTARFVSFHRLRSATLCLIRSLLLAPGAANSNWDVLHTGIPNFHEKLSSLVTLPLTLASKDFQASKRIFQRDETFAEVVALVARQRLAAEVSEYVSNKVFAEALFTLVSRWQDRFDGDETEHAVLARLRCMSPITLLTCQDLESLKSAYVIKDGRKERVTTLASDPWATVLLKAATAAWDIVRNRSEYESEHEGFVLDSPEYVALARATRMVVLSFDLPAAAEWYVQNMLRSLHRLLEKHVSGAVDQLRADTEHKLEEFWGPGDSVL